MLVTALAPWLTATSSEVRQMHVQIYAPPSLASAASRIESMDYAAIERALVRAGLASPPDVNITLVAHDHPQLTQTPVWVVGQAFGEDRLIIFPERVGNYPHGSLESVVTHEIAHLALTRQAGARALPRWFHEGVAVSVESGWGVGSQLRLLLAAQQDPALDDLTQLFTSDSLPAAGTAYLLSAALIEDLRQRHGADIPGRIANRVASGEPFASAFVHATGETPDAAAQSAWRVYRGMRWVPVLTSPSGVWGLILSLACIAFVARLRRRREQRRQWEEEEREGDADDRLDPTTPSGS